MSALAWLILAAIGASTFVLIVAEHIRENRAATDLWRAATKERR